jgi:hypothetical protein
MSESLVTSFNVPSPAKLSIRNIRGSIEILPGEDGVIKLTAIKQPLSGDEKRTEIEITQEDDGTVRANTCFPDGSWNWLFGSQPCEVDYEVKVPRLCSLKVNGVSNTVLAQGCEGEFSVNSISGEITLRDLIGSVRIHTVSGDTNGGRIKGSISLDTVSGEVTLKESNLSFIQGKSVSGDMRICTSLAEGPYNFISVSGDVCLTVPPETKCTAELQSVSGDLFSAFPISGTSIHHRSRVTNVHGGGVKISLHSVSGDLSIDCEGVLPEYADSLKISTSEERRIVLERVERGELTVEEAVGQLQG